MVKRQGETEEEVAGRFKRDSEGLRGICREFGGDFCK